MWTYPRRLPTACGRIPPQGGNTWLAAKRVPAVLDRGTAHDAC